MTAAVLDRPGSLFGDAPGADSASSAGRLSRGGVTLEEAAVLGARGAYRRQRRVPRVSRAYDIHARARVQRLRQPTELATRLRSGARAAARPRRRR